MKMKYICETCGQSFDSMSQADFHERNHVQYLWEYPKAPKLGNAALMALVKEDKDMVPSMVCVDYNGKKAWYKFMEFAK